MRLFEARGFDVITVDEVAAAIGISRRTIFRHFATKADIVLQPILVGFRALPDGLCAQPPDLPIGQALVETLHALVEALEEQRGLVARHLRLVAQSEPLRALSRGLIDDAMDNLRLELAQRLGEKDPEALQVTLWAEIMFVAAFGGRNLWLLVEEQPIAPIIADSVQAIRDFANAMESWSSQRGPPCNS